MLYEMLSGRLPFADDTAAAMVFQHAYDEPMPLDQATPGLPPPILTLVGRMIAKDPADRYPTCAAVLADLKAISEDRPIEMASSRLESNNAIAQNGRQWLAIACVIVALTFVLLLMLFFVMSHFGSQATTLATREPQNASSPSSEDLLAAQRMIASLVPQRFAKVRVDTGEFAELREGADLWPGGNQSWKKIPEYLKNMAFLQVEKHLGHTRFSVEKPGVVLVAFTTRWGGGGNSSGSWRKLVTGPDKLHADGWHEVGLLERTPVEGHDWLLFWRECQAGDSFDLRSEKYQAPIVILPESNLYADAHDGLS